MSAAIQKLISPHVQDLGGFQARRLLPNEKCKMVGPFIFFDHLGPATFAPGQGLDVRPHPHINLATVTYLFEGSILHRDSLGTVQEIRPGAVNWMIAGQGIVHSERSPDAERAIQSTLHGIQTWVALPDELEEVAPSFHHHPASEIPTWQQDGVTITLIAGTSHGQVSPVKALSPMLYLDLQFTPGGQFTVAPHPPQELALYSVTSGLKLGCDPLEPYRLAVLDPHQSITITADAPARCMVVGGEAPGPRYKWWNFVSSRLDRIEQAKQDWRDAKFGQVPNETEFIPLPKQAS